MFQYILAEQLRSRLGQEATVYGPGIPEWEIAATPAKNSPGKPLILKGHLFDLDEAAFCLRSGLFDAIIISGWGMRLEYYPRQQEIRDMFVSNVSPIFIEDDEILINVRAEDIESGKYPGYYPLPFDFYRSVANAEGKRPVFMGQLEPSEYTYALRKAFPDARYLTQNSALQDFQTIRHAKHVALSISSFSWFAAWLSQTAVNIHYPVAGIFDPRRGKQNLMPIGDTRYKFWATEFPSIETRTKLLSAAQWASQYRAVRKLDSTDLQILGRSALSTRIPISTGIPHNLSLDVELSTI